MNVKGTCRICDQTVLIWKLAKNIQGKPVLEFHTFEEKQCKGSYTPPAQDSKENS